MEELQRNSYLRKDSATADFETLNHYGQDLERLPNKHAAIDFLKYTDRLPDENYKEFQAAVARGCRGRC